MTTVKVYPLKKKFINSLQWRQICQLKLEMFPQGCSRCLRLFVTLGQTAKLPQGRQSDREKPNEKAILLEYNLSGRAINNQKKDNITGDFQENKLT